MAEPYTRAVNKTSLMPPGTALRGAVWRARTAAMPMLVAGLLLLWLSSILLRGVQRANPAALARLLRQGGGSIALLLAAAMILRGELNVALLAAGVGLWLVAKPAGASRRLWASWPGGFTGRVRPDAGPIRVRTNTLDVVIDRAAGLMRGQFTGGPHAGRLLESLSGPECAASYRWCIGADPEAARVLEAYLDGRFPGWRVAAEFGDDTRRTEAGGRTGRPVRMPDHEAYHVLGLAEGASGEEIARAHRALMKLHHPDHGGSTAMAARVNEAKDVLMRRHR
ncbi:DnaJ domain-containing protein [Lichenihabitans sp. Uapishka_5]|uniref:DnaJ domain-containing protein n=1 Tax=Lichenihabitans sp. Uapishka_5 TaxID=3037302 RepID=UPI0029E80364|nr:DnaJ domain-containing protein [Lichenihabitans sp. Uapishka_5]MDX7949889.1 DnaJ domain-containing protein [Lichenihabitans sp. Uapishka_5]